MKLATNALKWGVWIGIATLLWLYLAYYIGLHTNGIWVFQIFMLVWFLITLTGFVVALRSMRRVSESWSYWVGFRAGILAAVVTALMAVVMQLGYYTVIHPEWPAYMVEQTRQHFTAQGLPAVEVEKHVESARSAFAMETYIVQSAVTALLTGVVLSALVMIFLRRKEDSQPQQLRTA